MTVATVDHRRPMLPVFSMLVAGAALTLGAVAIATDDVSTGHTAAVPGGRHPAPRAGSPGYDTGRLGSAELTPKSVRSLVRVWSCGAEPPGHPARRAPRGGRRRQRARVGGCQRAETGDESGPDRSDRRTSEPRGGVPRCCRRRTRHRAGGRRSRCRQDAARHRVRAGRGVGGDGARSERASTSACRTRRSPTPFARSPDRGGIRTKSTGAAGRSSEALSPDAGMARPRRPASSGWLGGKTSRCVPPGVGSAVRGAPGRGDRGGPSLVRRVDQEPVDAHDASRQAAPAVAGRHVPHRRAHQAPSAAAVPRRGGTAAVHGRRRARPPRCRSSAPSSSPRPSAAGPRQAMVSEVYERCGGNPFLVEEVIAAGVAGGSGRLPPRLRDILLARTTSLTPQAAEVLRIAAVGGPRIDDALLRRVSPLEPEALDSAVRELLDCNVLEPHADDRVLRLPTCSDRRGRVRGHASR